MGQKMAMRMDRLNQLLARALAELGAAELTIVQADRAMRPWLPESYWRQQQEQAEREEVRAWLEGHLVENASVADLMAEWDAELPSLQGDNETLRQGGWGVHRMDQTYGYGGTLKAPTPGAQQPSYSYECYQCSRPITVNGKDHAGRTRCDHATLDPSESGHRDHQPKPWHGEEVEDDQDDQ